MVTKKQGSRALSVRLKTAKKRSVSSQRWLTRQLNDPYVQQAQSQGYRSRAAFKLLEIDDKFKILKPGQRILDLGAAPGGWTQVAVQKTTHPTKKTSIIGIDLSPMDPIEGAVLLQGDFLAPDSFDRLREHLPSPQGHPQADVILSDMAASSTGHPQTDHWRIIHLIEASLDLVQEVMAPGGCFVAKVLQGGTEHKLLALVKTLFQKVTHFKPPASRKDSSEIYLVALNFRGNPLKKETP